MTQILHASLSAANEALKEIIAISNSNRVLDKFTHDRLERIAKSSIPIDAAFSYATLGALEAVYGNEELMDSYHKNSIKLCDNVLMRGNYACSLRHVLRLKEASEQARIASSLAESDVNALKEAISFTVQAGEIALAASLVPSYYKLVPTDTSTYEVLMAAADLMKTLGISQEEVMQLIQIACDLLRNKKISYIRQNMNVDEEDGGFLSLCIMLNQNNDEIIALNRLLFEIMLDKVPNQSPRLSVRFGRRRAE